MSEPREVFFFNEDEVSEERFFYIGQFTKEELEILDIGEVVNKDGNIFFITMVEGE